MAKRTKKTVISGVSREQYEQAFAEFAMADAKAQSLTAKMDQEMTKIREKYADQLAELNETKDRSFEVMQTYATENKDTLFSKKKSLESAHGIIGFRTGNPKLKNRKGFTWAAVTNLCKEFLPQYIRTTEELAKDKLLADRDIPEIADPIRFLRAREVVHFQRFGEALRSVQEQLDAKNFYAFNPSFDCPCEASCKNS